MQTLRYHIVTVKDLLNKTIYRSLVTVGPVRLLTCHRSLFLVLYYSCYCRAYAAGQLNRRAKSATNEQLIIIDLRHFAMRHKVSYVDAYVWPLLLAVSRVMNPKSSEMRFNIRVADQKFRISADVADVLGGPHTRLYTGFLTRCNCAT